MPHRLIHQGSWLRAAWQGVTALAVAMILLVCAVVEFEIYKERSYASEDATQTARNYARLFEEHIARAISEADRTITFVRQLYLAAEGNFDLKEWGKTQSALDNLTIQLSIIGADGYLQSTTTKTTSSTKMDLSDREHFRVHVASQADNLFISKPVLGRASGRWTIQLTRRINRPDGSFGGVIVASLDVYRLSQFYDSIDTGEGGTITVVGVDGIIRARAGLSAETLGRTLEEPVLFDMAKRMSAGTYRASSEQANQITAFRVIPQYSLIVTVGLSEAETFAASSRAAALYRTGGGILTVILLAVIAIGTRHRLRLIATMQELVSSRQSETETAHELEVTLNNIAQGIIMVDANHKVAVMNQRAIDLLDLPQEFLGSRMDFRDLFEHQRIAGEFARDEDALIPTLQRLLKADGLSAEFFVYERRRPDGRMLEVRNFALPDGGFVRTFTDITERKDTEIALADARDHAESATRAKSAFLAAMSHEIRTPLNGIVGMLSLLQHTPLTAEQARFVGTIDRCSEALLEIITDILDYSKLESGEIELDETDTDIRSVIESAIDIIAARLNEKGLPAHVKIALDVPSMIRTNSARLRQILLNLLSNAVKFTETGSITIAVSRSPTGGQVRRLRFEVRDTGIGISTSAQKRLFREFSQVDASITRRYGGTGLGLAICKRIIVAMTGTIGVDSNTGEGSTFWFEIPETAAKTTTTTEAPKATTSTTPLHVLVVEDNAVNREVASLLLKRLGHTVELVEDGSQAVRVCEQNKFDVILMDMQMPVMDGLEATRHIRRAPSACSETIIIGLTANAFSSDRAACLRAGMNAFIAKPVDRAKLERALAEANPHKTITEDQSSDKLDVAHRTTLFTEIGMEAARQLVGAFWEAAPKIVESCRDAVAQRDMRTLGREIHTLKGTAMNLGYADLAQVAARVEAGLRAGEVNPEDLPRLIESALKSTAAMEPLLKGRGALNALEAAPSQLAS